MTDALFFKPGEGITLAGLAELCEARLEADAGSAERLVFSLAPLDSAGSEDLAFLDQPRYADELSRTRAGAVVLSERLAASAPEGLALLVSRNVQRSFALAGRALYPQALAPNPHWSGEGISDKADVDPTARLEPGVIVEPFAAIGAGVEIGRGTIVASGARIGPGCRIGRDCRIGPNVVLQHALLGNRVILHPGVTAGQDGFGYSASSAGVLKMVQIGRVILQDDVEVGANSTIDRGAIRDTVIGEGTKIDNQVQIAHNVEIGRNCFIVAQVGIAGSATIGDNVAIGGQSGVNGHVSIGNGAQIAAVSSVAGNVPPGARWGGTPAHPVRDWMREMTWLRESAKSGKGSGKSDG